MRPEQDFQVIGIADLDAITGGRQSMPPDTVDPALIQGIGELAKAVQVAGQTIASAKAQTGQGMMQMIQQLVQMKR